MPNHLASETSPYLLQHADNPVDWYPWSDAVLAMAHQEDRPIFLSIGYAACHWCHVMAHESFEDPATARLMNDHFINVKVDREERPDLDSIYMDAVVSMTGQGGWPMSVFLTPDGEPFYGGTYFPPAPRYGMPAFKEILTAISRVWREDRDHVFQVSKQLVDRMRSASAWISGDGKQPGEMDLKAAAQKLISTYDWQDGGWGGAPRFPAPLTIEFLLQQGARGSDDAVKVCDHLLKAMQRGGMYDVIGGGFHRYSTDEQWLIPHFEKMLYDNAQLSLVYLHAYLLTGETSFKITCEETLDFLLREMTHPMGGFFSSLDADSEGQEGKFYLWTLQEISSVLVEKDDADLFLKLVPVTAGGNFDGKNILQKSADGDRLVSELGITPENLRQRLAEIFQLLRAARAERSRPHTDDKILTAWNSLAIKAFAEAGRSLGRADFMAAAQKNADFLLKNLYQDHHLLRSWREGQARHNAYLEDYAALSLALIALYQADGNIRWYEWAVRIAADMKTGFTDPAGGFFDTHHDHDSLLVRPKAIQDNATPSGNSMAALALLQLAEFSGDVENRREVETFLASLRSVCLQYPSAFSFWLQAMDFAVGPVRQIALVWPAEDPPPADFLRVLNQGYHPRAVIAASTQKAGENQSELLKNRLPIGRKATAYVCENFICRQPTTSLDDFREMVNRQ